MPSSQEIAPWAFDDQVRNQGAPPHPVAGQVSWSGVTNATEADVIALFVPANQSVDTVVPVKYKWVNAVPGWEAGSGSFV